MAKQKEPPIPPRAGERWLSDLKPGKKRREIPDSVGRGLYIFVETSGAKRWKLRTKIDEKWRRLSLGDWPETSLADARQKAGDGDFVQTLIHRRSGPKAPDALTAFVLWDKFSRSNDFRKLRAATRRNYERNWRLYVVPVFETANIAELGGRDLIRLAGQIVSEMESKDKSSEAINTALRAASSVINWGAGRALNDHVKFSGLQQRTQSRDRVLSADELKAIWRGCDHILPEYAALIRFAMVTAQRRGVCAGLMFSDIDRDNGRWLIRGEIDKGAKDRSIKLSPLALSLIDWRRPVSNLPFSNTDNGVSNVAREKRVLDENAGVNDWRLHDFRRSFASWAEADGFEIRAIDAALGHDDKRHKAGAASAYMKHRYNDEADAVLAAWSDYIQELCNA